MKQINTEKKEFVSNLNTVFVILTSVKLLMTVVLPFWQRPVRSFLELLGVENADEAIKSLSSESDIAGLCFGTALYLLCVSIPVFASFIFRSENEDDGFFVRMPTAPQAFCAIGTTFFVSYAVTGLLFLLFDRLFAILGYRFSPPVSETPSSPYLIPLYIVYLCVLPAISEELLLRGLAMNTLKKCGKGFAVIFSAVLFMMMHTSPANYIFSFCAGICMGYFSLRFNSLKLGIIIHFFLNLNSAVLRLTEKYLHTTAGQMAYTLYFIFVAVFALTFFIAFAVVFKFRKLSHSNEMPPFQKRLLLKQPFLYIFIFVFIITSYFGVISMFS